MADNTKIEWTDATVNAVNGCSVCSPGCKNCYAMRLAGTRLRDHPTRVGLTTDSKAGPVWNGEIRVNEKAMLEPLRWAKPRMCFWNAHGDTFHPAVPDTVIDRCFAVMALTPLHTHQVLTKRSARMRAYMGDPKTPGRIARTILDMAIHAPSLLKRESWPVQTIGDIDYPDDVTVTWPLANVWLGVSVEDQQRADERIPDLLATPAAVRWLSCEPLLGAVDLMRVHFGTCGFDPAEGSGLEGFHTLRMTINALAGVQSFGWRGLDWIVAGGESGLGARPMHPDWARSLRDQCAAAGVPFLFKQWGAWAPLDTGLPAWHGNAAWPDGSVGFGDAEDRGGEGEAVFLGTKAITGRLLDGVQHDGYPAGNAR